MINHARQFWFMKGFFVGAFVQAAISGQPHEAVIAILFLVWVIAMEISSQPT